MPDMQIQDQIIFKAIKESHKKRMEEKIAAYSTHYFKDLKVPENIPLWLEKIEESRLLANRFLDHIPPRQAGFIDKTAALLNLLGEKIITLLVPPTGTILIENLLRAEESFIGKIASDLLSQHLLPFITQILIEDYKNRFSIPIIDAEKLFTENSEPKLLLFLKKECEQMALEFIKLFFFREMLLSGKLSTSPLEPESRKEFIKKAQLEKLSDQKINEAIEVYFAHEWAKILQKGFQAIYVAQQKAIQEEDESIFKKRLHQLFNSTEHRLLFTQEIQIKFLELASDFLLEKKNEPGNPGKHPLAYSLITASILAPVLALVFALTLGTGFGLSALIAIAGFLAVATITYNLIQKIDALAYQRSKENRQQIQNSVDTINNTVLQLQKQVSEQKDSPPIVLEKTHDFQKINQYFLIPFKKKYIARGSASGWLREYAARYRHSKQIEIDLEEEYNQLILQSRRQTQELIQSINSGQVHLLQQWVEDTQSFIRNPDSNTTISEFELIPKIKEQILDIVRRIDYIPPKLLSFYCSDNALGGLSGAPADFSQIKRLAPLAESYHSVINPYHQLCETALHLYHKKEPLFSEELILYGDPDYREMLGIPRCEPEKKITAKNIDEYLENSYALLFSLCKKSKPGQGLDPLKQTALLNDEFILYRMLLLKQLASYCNNQTESSEVILKINNFIKNRFLLDPAVIFDDLSNQLFLLQHTGETSAQHYNSQGILVKDKELEHIFQAIQLDMAYNSVPFKNQDILLYFMQKHLTERKKEPMLPYLANKTALNPQGTQFFLETIKDYTSLTSSFLQITAANKALTLNNIHECYRYNVSLQVYTTQLRIACQLKELNLLEPSFETEKQGQFLLSAFLELSRFVHIHAFDLLESSKAQELLTQMEYNCPKIKRLGDWNYYLPSSQVLNNLLETLPNNVKTASSPRTQFFRSAKVVPSRDQEETSFLTLTN